MSKYKAVGIHVFAGGFTLGVKRVFDVQCQLETHGFGLETAEQVMGVPTINRKDADWPRVDAHFVYGNPRCTGFSMVTSGMGEGAHGPWSKQTCDIHELCKYSAGHYDVVIWESVQEAATTGKPLLDYLRDEYFQPKGYRIAHLFVNAASFGNAQQRKRYFFVAYRGDKNFNVTPPDLSTYYGVAYDVYWKRRDRVTHPGDRWLNSPDYDADTHRDPTPDEAVSIPHLPNGWSLNVLGKYAPHRLSETNRIKYATRVSDLPFSLHAPYRLNYLRPHPTLTSSTRNCIHPEFDRPVTVGELAETMGWGDLIPVGPYPIAQIAKGVVPDVGQWLAEQARAYLDDEWGSEDFESTYDAMTGEWVGGDTTGRVEKTFDLTEYVGRSFDRSRYEVTDATLFKHRHLVEAAGRGRSLAR